MPADAPSQDKDNGPSGHKDQSGPHDDSSAKDNAVDTSSVPNPQRKNRPMSEDEKVDQAAIESMDASDPPAFQPSTTGAAPDRQTDKSKTKP
jgi:hypothetical protein